MPIPFPSNVNENIGHTVRHFADNEMQVGEENLFRDGCRIEKSLIFVWSDRNTSLL